MGLYNHLLKSNSDFQAAHGIPKCVHHHYDILSLHSPSYLILLANTFSHLCPIFWLSAVPFNFNFYLMWVC